MQIHVVQAGDSVDAIAMQYGISTDAIAFNNQILYPYNLAIGQALLILDGSETQDRKTMVSNGCVYQYISPWVLEQTLPYLTEMSVFSYSFTIEGDLIHPELDDTWMIRKAKENNTIPILTLTSFDPDGTFNHYLVKEVSNNLEAQRNLIAQLLKTAQETGYGGVSIDFEFILPEDRVAYAEFVKNVTNAMNAHGYQVSVTLAPKISAGQKGFLYEGRDYKLLGEAANFSLLMTYGWGYSYGPPMAIAPINKVREVIDYAVTEIPRDKICMGIPDYGYDWTLPFQKGITEARVIGNAEAVQIAIAYDVPIQFDEAAMSPFFHYIQDGTEHEVWFEDVRSMQAKLALVEEYGFRGAFYGQVMELFRANWLLLASTFWIRK